MAVVGSLPCRGRVEGAGGARGRGKRARRGQRATANTAPGDYVACRRGTVSSYPRRPPCSYWPTSLPRIHRAPSLFLFLSLSPLLSSPLIRALLLPLAFSNRRGSPVFFLLLLLPLLCPPLPPSPRSFFFLLSFPCFARLGSVSSPQGFLRRHRRRYGRFRFRRRDEEV